MVFVAVLSQKPSIKSLVKIGSVVLVIVVVVGGGGSGVVVVVVVVHVAIVVVDSTNLPLKFG